MRHQFGWDLPPGVSVKDIEDAQEDDSDLEYDNVEYICVKCLKREAVINNVCGMCSELHPYMV